MKSTLIALLAATLVGAAGAQSPHIDIVVGASPELESDAKLVNSWIEDLLKQAPKGAEIAIVVPDDAGKWVRKTADPDRGRWGSYKRPVRLSEGIGASLAHKPTAIVVVTGGQPIAGEDEARAVSSTGERVRNEGLRIVVLGVITREDAHGHLRKFAKLLSSQQLLLLRPGDPEPSNLILRLMSDPGAPVGSSEAGMSSVGFIAAGITSSVVLAGLVIMLVRKRRRRRTSMPDAPVRQELDAVVTHKGATPKTIQIPVYDWDDGVSIGAGQGNDIPIGIGPVVAVTVRRRQDHWELDVAPGAQVSANDK
ncbi:MAG TPA: hypothetical protein VEX38_01345, partial [Fimbriimonadaceae bacterium]|nr:hypothetical protein [Fimbriimonadaceae bacterium]